MRTIKKIHLPENANIGDLVTYRAMPTRSIGMEEIEPFLFLNHHGPQVYKAKNNGLPFGPHPHKGFETVTFILEGDILHKDTKGHESVITAGGIQWMTAGKGVVHSEISSKEFKEKGGALEILQLWINLPAKHKFADPYYKGLQKNDIPAISEDNGKVTINLISGNWKEKKAPIQPLTDITMTTINFKPGAKLNTKVDANREIFFYNVNGELKVNGKAVKTRELVQFNKDGENLEIEALSDAIILFGHAKPNHEPIVARGPFVMNTVQEINEAYNEYYEGKFGSLE